MCVSIFFAQVLGAYLLLASLAALLHQERSKKVATEELSHHGLLYFTGALSLLFGIIVVVTHNIWVSAWPVLVTLIGWFMLLLGALRLFCPVWFAKKLKESMTKNVYTVMCCVWLVIGIFLLWAGFSS